MSLAKVEESVFTPAARPSRASGGPRDEAVARDFMLGLAGRLLVLVIAAVLFLVALLYATRLAAVEENWARDRIAAAYTAAQAFAPETQVDSNPELDRKILDSIGAQGLEIAGGKRHWSIGLAGNPDFSGLSYDIDQTDTVDAVRLAVQALLNQGRESIVVRGPSPLRGSRVALRLDIAGLRAALLRLSTTFLTLSLGLSLALALVLWSALWGLVIRPVRRLTNNILAFSESEQKHALVIEPSGRRDEIGRAEKALAGMQLALADELRQRKRLAELGMAVARINHDLRNMLSAAQLISDRIASIPDPLAQRLAPRLVGTLDRAIAFCQATLAYGAGHEREADPKLIDLRAIVRQVVETAEAEKPGEVAFAIDIPPKFEIFADPDHVTRIVENLALNARKALAAADMAGRAPAIRFAAIRDEMTALIEVSDNGPGIPEAMRERIFLPFHSSASAGGSGLGLAIAADLVERNGGVIALARTKDRDFYGGARFIIRLPAVAQATSAPPRLRAAE